MSNTGNVSRRDALATLAASAIAITGAPAVLRGRYRLFADSAAKYSSRAIRLVERTVVIDMLNQFRFPDYAEHPPKSELWLNTPRSFTAADFEQYRTSGVRVFALGAGEPNYEAGIRYFADWNGFIAGYTDWFTRIESAGDFERLKKSNKVGIMLTFQNADHFRTADDVDTFHSLGQRVSLLTYNSTNRLGSGFLADTDVGLTPFGAEIVARMNQAGMAVDLSHCGDRTTLDGIAATRKPAIFTHAACRALVPGHLRCKTDEMIVNLARTGGVMGIPLIRFMLKIDEPVTQENVLDHFDHVSKLVGVEHVGVGSDLDLVGNPNPVHTPGGNDMPSGQHNFDRYHVHADADGRLTVRGLDHPRRMYDLTEGLIRRKYSDANIEAILGGNWQRVLGTIWGS
ncbi:MAG TPA: membrane dipeptidase [Gemmatimonadaceae bacterium]|nr:membrane dipeptidase [Gemmatimonadaceae bacterium]